LAIGLLGIIINQTPSDAYLPIILPFLIFMIAITFSELIKIRYVHYPVAMLLIIIIILNSFAVLRNDLVNDLQNRIKIANEIIIVANNKPYNLVAKGIGSEFSSTNMNYEYLLWWKGHQVSKEDVNAKIVVWQLPKEIIIYKK
jgi:hypothetical protein